MGKRGNENAQMSKEDYEAMESGRGSNDDANDMSQGFQRASAEQMKARRKVTVRRPPGSGIGASSPATSASSNPFSGLKGTGNSAAGAASTTPASGLFKFKVPPAPVPTFPTTTSSTTTTTNATTTTTTSELPTPAQKRAMSLEKELVKQMQALEGEYMGASLEDTILYSYSKYCAAQMMDWADKNPALAGRKDDEEASEATESEAAPASSSSSSSPTKAPLSSPSKPLFGASSSSATTAAPAPTGNFQFGDPTASNKAATGGFSLSSSAPAPAPAATGGFKFGATTSPAANSSATAPAPATTGFNFLGSTATTPAVAPPASGLSFGTTAPAPSGGGFSIAASTEAANKAAAAAPTPGFSFGGPASAPAADEENASVPADDDGPSVVEVADEGWDDLEIIQPVSFYQQKKDKSWTIIQRLGKVRLQQEKDKKVFRILMRDDHGLKVLLNSTVRADTTIIPKLVANKKNVEIGQLLFTGVNDAARGPEMFLIKSSKDVHEKLVARMESMKKHAAN